MPLHTKGRKYPYPAKSETFDSSWDTFQLFFNQLDREFTSAFNFMVGTGIEFIWITENELTAQKGMKYGDFGVRLDTGGIYEYRRFVDESGKPGWRFKYDINSLPLNIDRDPTGDDWGMPKGYNWINNTSGESFYCIKNDIGRTIWVSENKAIGHEVKFGYFVPRWNFEFAGEYLNGTLEQTGRFYYTNGEESVTLKIGGKKVGSIKLEAGRTYYSVGDLDIMSYPPTDLENAGKCNSDLFLRFLTFMGTISTQSSPSYSEFHGVVLSKEMIEIISTESSMVTELSRMNLPAPTVSFAKEMKYDFYHTITYLEAVNNTIKKILLRCMACIGLSSYDGNIVLVDGNEILADGNENPPCA